MYNQYQYNVAGMNFSLNDIEHGILRTNNNYGKSVFCVVLNGIFKKSLDNRKKPRFGESDPRRKYVL